MRFTRASLVVVVLCALGLPRLARADAQLVSFGDAGLRLGDTVLFDKAVTGAAYDPLQDLVWFRTGSTLEVVDLRDPTYRAVPILKKIPVDGAFAVTGMSNVGWWTGPDEWVVSYPVLTIGKTAKVKARQVGDFGDNSSEDRARKKAIKKVKVVGAAWLKKQRKRAPRATPTVPPNQPAELVTVPEALASCEEEGLCGTAFGLGDTGYEVVVTTATYGPGSLEQTCLLYDPKRKEFASPSSTEPAAWGASEPEPGPCTGYAVDPSGTQYVLGTMLCTLGDPVACRDTGVENLGWADAASP